MVEFQVTRIVDRPRDVVFAVVADVERYPEFVPGFAGAHIRRVGERKLDVMQRVGFKGIHASFRSTAELDPPEHILIRSHDWPFRHLHQEWQLDELDDETTKVTFTTSYSLVSGRLDRLLGQYFERLLGRTVDAFERRLAGDIPDAAP